MNRRRFSFVLLVGFLLTTVSATCLRADLQADFAAAIERARLGRTQCGLYVVDLEANRELVSINADSAFMPASNMKVVTTAAALATLGPDFVFRTELRLLEKSDTGAAVLVVHGDGDPGFGDAKLLSEHQLDVEKLLGAWVKAVKDAGVSKVGKLILDDRIFDYTLTHPSWPTNQLNSWYCAQVSGLIFCDNCLEVYATPSAKGGAPRIDLVPAAPFLAISNSAVSGAPDSFKVSRRAGTNELICSGVVRNRSVEPIEITLNDPAGFFAQVLAHRLAQAGIGVESIRRAGSDEKLAPGTTLHAVQTTLPAVLGRCLKNSQNLFAEALFKRVGFATTGSPGSWDNGSKAVMAFLTRHAGVKEGSVVIADGCGLSRDDRVTPRAMAQVLTLMHRQPTMAGIYRQSLSIAGQDGTLKDRMRSGLTGQVYGKTGYIVGVSTVSGYLVLPAVDRAGKPASRTIAFSLLFNDAADVHAIKGLQDHLIQMIDAAMTAQAAVR